MNKRNHLLDSSLVAVLASMLTLTSCDDLSEDSHYKTPSFLAGNAIEVLQKDGNYSVFLKGIELTGYTDVVDSQILTVLAPTDEAFAAFLKEQGYSSIEDMYAADPEFTTQVITYHLLYYAMDWSKMTNFRPLEGDGATESQRADKAGMYNRFRTRCAVNETQEFDSDPAVNDYVTVIHRERYVTVFSETLFRTLGIDAASNYNYFFPDTEWNPKGLADGFNIMNAAVLDSVAVVTDNGYLYHIDHVLNPVGTIYEELDNNGKYSKFLKLFDEYAEYTQDVDETNNRGYNVYTKSFGDLPAIASEWASDNYRNFTTNSFVSYNILAPSDQAMDDMFTKYWEPGCGYASVDSLNPLIQNILVNECAIALDLTGEGDKTDYACYPEFLTMKRAYSEFGTEVTNSPSEFDDAVFCNNGILYGSSKMEVPGVFSCVAGPSFKDVKYLPYLYVLNGSGQLLNLAGNQAEFVALVPDTAQFAKNDPAGRLYYDRVNNTYELQIWSDESADYVSMGRSYMENVANMHTSTNATELKTEGTQVIETNAAFNYWFVKDGKITTNYLFNQQLNPTYKDEIWYGFHEITNAGEKWSNGRAYSYDYPGIYTTADGMSLESELCTNNDYNYPYYCFAQLLRLSGLANSGLFSGMLTLDPESPRFIALVPTNEVLKDAIEKDLIPGCDTLHVTDNFSIYMNNKSGSQVNAKLTDANKQLLSKYLLCYFITADRNGFTAYPYVGSTCKGVFETGGTFNVEILDDGSAISVRATGDGVEGTEVSLESKYGYLPFAYSDGAFQLLNGILK